VLINFNVVLAQFLSLSAGFILFAKFCLRASLPKAWSNKATWQSEIERKKLLFEKKRKKTRQSLKQKNSVTILFR
jgi:hypothetical protein